MTLELVIFAGIVLLIVFVSYKLGSETTLQRQNDQLPLYRALVVQHTILNLAKMGYLRTIVEDGKIVVIPLEENQGETDVTQKSSEPKEEA